MLPVSGAEQLKTMGDDQAAAHDLAEHPVLPVGQPDADLLVGHEEVPEALGLRLLAQLDDARRDRPCRSPS